MKANNELRELQADVRRRRLVPILAELSTDTPLIGWISSRITICWSCWTSSSPGPSCPYRMRATITGAGCIADRHPLLDQDRAVALRGGLAGTWCAVLLTGSKTVTLRLISLLT